MWIFVLGGHGVDFRLGHPPSASRFSLQSQMTVMLASRVFQEQVRILPQICVC